MDEVFYVAKNKSENPNQKQENNSLLIGIGIGTVLLVLAEIFCVMGELYAVFSKDRAILVTIISALLLFGTTGVFIYILRDTLLQKTRPEPTPVLEVSGDPNHQMTAEEIAALFENL